MRLKSENMTNITGRLQKEWCPPVLQRLPIAATANTGKAVSGNEGQGKGAGDNTDVAPS